MAQRAAVDVKLHGAEGSPRRQRHDIDRRGGGEVKLAGIGQRVITAGAHVGGVIVVRGAGRIREVLEPVYEALELDWDPATTGSVANEIGEEDETFPADVPDPLLERVIAAVRTVLARDYELHDADLDEDTIRLAEELRSDHTAPA